MKLPMANWFLPTKENNYQPKLLRKGAFVFYTISLLVVNLLSGSLMTPISAGEISASELIALCNEERDSAGLNTLSANSKLTSAATAKAQNMFEEQYWDHYGPNGETPWQFILAAGYDYVYAGENLAKGFTTSEAVHAAWMASASHRENIINPNYKDIGIAAVPGELLGENVILVVQMFGATSVLPATDDSDDDNEVPEDDNQSYPIDDNDEPDYIPQVDDSLEIDYPKDGDALTSDDFDLKGTSGISTQDIEIFNNSESLGDAICQEGIWDFRPEKGWEDGEYNVHAEGSIGGVSDSVNFLLDTLAPTFVEDSLDISYEVGILSVSVVIEGDPAGVNLVIGEKEVEMKKLGSGEYEGSILVTSADLSGDCEIVASDGVGNYSTLGILNEVKALVSSVEDNRIGIKVFSDLFNYVVIVGLSGLFILDLYYLYKLKKIEAQGKTLFKTAIWVIILGVTMIVGTTGTIY